MSTADDAERDAARASASSRATPGERRAAPRPRRAAAPPAPTEPSSRAGAVAQVVAARACRDHGAPVWAAWKSSVGIHGA